MAILMTPEEYAEASGTNLESLQAAIEEARNDAVAKDSMNQESLSIWNMTSETESFLRDYLLHS